ncbi:leucine-rich repeat domain-containing protein [Aequorivita marina]|uniref:leucine-rich repeat domain-containing protein n=1 Tax=Aequorivita marina TaxID=3073654 RepID=UPI0028759D3E|nr:T9SS type A sorting domain-containing protein [Aequorivita sp. S2608]MDS1298974.1 T9SS type A sorting domain-containing protein [Aequorivita sp. S2608]
MKNYYIIFLFFLSSIAQAQIVNIPDSNFLDVLVNTNCVDTNGDGYGDSPADTNNDGQIQVIEAEAVIGLIVGDYQLVTSLEGIQSFTNLENLNVKLNALTELEVSQNTNLKFLNCDYNEIASLDLSQNLSLEKLSCVQNHFLATLILPQNINFKELSVSENLLTSLDITQYPNLELLWCNSNQLTELDVSQNPNLKILGFSGNQITNIDVTQNANLESLSCSYNQLSELDVTQNTILESLSCDENSLTNLDISQNPLLKTLTCSENLLTSLDLSQNTRFEYFQCKGNLLTSLDLSQNTMLQELFCDENNLTYLNIRNGNNHNMTSMYAYNNPNLNIIMVDCDDDANNKDCYEDRWCKDSTATYTGDCTLGTEDFQDVQFTLYPNPTQNILSIDSPEPFNSVRIYSITGSLIKETSNSQVDVSSLASGIYFVKVYKQGRNSTKKVVKI